MVSIEEFNPIKQTLPFLEKADGQLVRSFRGEAYLAKLPADRDIYLQGDIVDNIALLLSGSVRVFKIGDTGREITLYRVEPGECCILTASCMLSGRPFPANAMVETDLDAIVIPGLRVSEWMQQHASWRHYLWDLLAARLGDVISLVEEVSFRRMDQRLADFLAEHLPANGDPLQATHQQIAADLGTSREVVSRILKDFEQRGLLDLGRGRISILDLDGLRGAVDEKRGAR